MTQYSKVVRRPTRALSVTAFSLLAAFGPLGVVFAQAPAPAPAASVAASTGSAGTSVTAAPPAAAASRPAADPAAPRPFMDVTRDAKQTTGYLNIWTKEERTWLEIPESQLRKPFLLMVNINQSVGERGLYGSQMGPRWMVEWRKVGNSVQLVALNQEFRSPQDQQMAFAVTQSFSDSLLFSTPMASAPHPTRKSILIDANALLADVPNYARNAEMAFRIPYNFDRLNSSLQTHRTEKDFTTVGAQMHFSTARIPLPPTGPTPPSAATPTPTPPKHVPDPRSFFVGYVYSFMPLPEKPMAVRLADPRLGHFSTAYTDLSNDLKQTNKVHMINRWRLEKKEPGAAMSEPVTPVTYWLDKNIPQRYRKTVMEGVLEWNKAFEAIGFKNAIVAKQQSDDASWDNMDAKHASIRWFTGADIGFAIGPSKTDPRTGEILDADIGMSDVFARGTRRFVTSDLQPTGSAPSSEATLAHVMAMMRGHSKHAHEGGVCNYAVEMLPEADFADALLEVRGDLAPDSPEAEAVVHARIKHTIMHEVGHTLGFKHNFKASTSFKPEDLQKPGPLSNSVMEYLPHNIPLKGEGKGSIINTDLGPYDYWVVAYAYGQFSPDTEAAELAKLAARNLEPQLAFADDADAGGFGGGGGIDPYANRHDLGNDPQAYYEKRLKLSQELFGRMADRKTAAGEDPLRVRRSLNSGFQQLGSVVALSSKYIGGMQMVRDIPGTTQRRVYTPVDPGLQRRALKFVTEGVFDSNSFKFPASLLTNLGVDYNEWERDAPFSVTERVAQIQNAALDQLMNARTANSLLEQPNFLTAEAQKGMLTLAEVYSTVQKAVWSELSTGANTDRIRRNLQREHLRRLTTSLTKGGWPGDAQAALRVSAQALQAQLQRAVAKPGKTNAEHQAHVKDSLNALTEALRASMTRTS